MKTKNNCAPHLRLIAIALTIAALSVPSAQAASTWTGLGGSVNWNTAGNWTGGTPTSSAATDLIFAGTTNVGTSGTPLNQNFVNPMTLNSITFDATAGNFFLGGSGLAISAGNTFTITQSSANNQSIANSISHTGNNGLVTLALAGNGGGVVTLSGAITEGNNASRALGITKSGTSTFVLNNTNTYTGITSVTGGTLIVNGNQSSATGAVNVASVAKLMGTGTIGGATNVLGTHSAGASEGAVGTQNFSSSLAYGNASIFEWDLNANSTSSGFDTVSAAGNISVGTNAVFNVVFGAGVNLANTFWSTTQTWSMASIFGKAFSAGTFASVTSTANPTTQGVFTLTGSGANLTWTSFTPVPEPTSALAGILLGAGLLRRKRVR
jgi:autotransporter-associated beta strand protein